jgi:DNA-binding FadR family transcriptional regulator
VVGSETELLERYGVSRAVLREAIRLVEHQQVARMRRGPGGGLVVTSPTLDSLADAVAAYLLYANARVDHVIEARMALEEKVAELAPHRITEDEIAALRDLARREAAGEVRNHREVHDLLAAITKNGPLAFSVALLSRLARLYSPDPSRIGHQTFAASARAHREIIDAVVAGDVGLTRYRMRKHLEAEAEYMRRRAHHRVLDTAILRTLDHHDKRGEVVARELLLEVVRNGWPVGSLLGSEAELMERFGVSRSVLREAVRLLEHHQIASMRRGPGGGLFVARPGVEPIVAAVALQLERNGVLPSELFELRTAVELTVVELAVKRLDETGEHALRDALERERSASRVIEEFVAIGHDLHDVLAAASGNPVLELFSMVLTRLTRLHQNVPPGGDPAAGSVEVRRTHARIVEAILDRDTELARHRMRRHLDALTSWVR